VVRDAEGAPDLAATMAGVAPLLAAGVTDLRFSQRWGTDLAATRDLLAATVAAFRTEVGRPQP